MTSQWPKMTSKRTSRGIFRPKSKIPFHRTCTSAACFSWSRLQGPIARFTTVESRIMLRWPPCIPLNETEFFLYKLFQVLSVVFVLKNNNDPSPTGNHGCKTGNCCSLPKGIIREIIWDNLQEKHCNCASFGYNDVKIDFQSQLNYLSDLDFLGCLVCWCSIRTFWKALLIFKIKRNKKQKWLFMIWFNKVRIWGFLPPLIWVMPILVLLKWIL